MMVDYEDLKEIVLVRLESMPPNIRVSVGSEKDMTKDDLIHEVKNDTDLGRLIIEIQYQYLKSMKKGF